jgi:hypothetical protein
MLRNSIDVSASSIGSFVILLYETSRVARYFSLENSLWIFLISLLKRLMFLIFLREKISIGIYLSPQLERTIVPRFGSVIRKRPRRHNLF